MLRARTRGKKKTGMVGMMGAGALTKKRGGYTNTKLHGMMAWAGMMLAGGGLYVIYKHKNVMGKDHFTTLHSWGEFTFTYDRITVRLFERARLYSGPDNLLFIFFDLNDDCRPRMVASNRLEKN
jgi:hypothetical protein